MRTLLILLIAVLLTTTANAQLYEGWPCKIKSQITPLDLGTVKKGSVEKVTFPFINDGTEPLVIISDQGGAEDIVLSIPKHPIKTGSKATITVELNTERSGPFRKKFELKTNCRKEPVVLEIFGNVEK